MKGNVAISNDKRQTMLGWQQRRQGTKISLGEPTYDTHKAAVTSAGESSVNSYTCVMKDIFSRRAQGRLLTNKLLEDTCTTQRTNAKFGSSLATNFNT